MANITKTKNVTRLCLGNRYQFDLIEYNGTTENDNWANGYLTYESVHLIYSFRTAIGFLINSYVLYQMIDLIIRYKTT